jgi:CO/xanthine dehydrogenase Mo-binding subunit
MRGTGVRSTVNRRDFILTAVSVAGGLMIGIGAAPRSADAAAISTQPWNDNDHAPHEIDAWIAIDPDDSVLIRYQRSEMGQGSMTALPMMITEELQCATPTCTLARTSTSTIDRRIELMADLRLLRARPISLVPHSV